MQIFCRDIWIPFLILLVAFIVLMIKDAISQDFSYNPFNKDDGFGTLLWLWDFNDPSNYNKFFGVNLLSKWPDAINTPHLAAEAWAGYIIVPLIFVGGFWYILVVQGLFARWLKIKQLVKTTFKKDLSNFNANTGTFNTPTEEEQKKYGVVGIRVEHLVDTTFE